jgi:hypothetical protein
MPGVIIYRTKSNLHYSFVSFDDDLYNAEKIELPKGGNTIIWDKGNVSLQQMQNARETKDDLVAKLNAGEKVDLDIEKAKLEDFFK